MSEIVRIESNGVLYALILPADARADGVQFLTEPEGYLQVGTQQRKAGTSTEPHAHRSRSDTVDRTEEVLILESGRIRVTVFDDSWQSLWSGEVGAGSVVIFVRGGHGIEWLEETRLVEVKQGPYGGRSEDKREANDQ